MRSFVIGVFILTSAVSAAISAMSVNTAEIDLAKDVPYTGFVTTFTYNVSPPPTPAPFTSTITWGFGGPQTTGVVTGSGSGPYTINTTSITFDMGGDNTDLQVTIVDSVANSGIGFGNFHVHDLVAPAPPSVTIDEGESFTQVCTFEDASKTSTKNLPSDYTATVSWGDGTTTAGVVEVVPSTMPGTYSVTGTHTYAVNGEYPLSCTLTHTASGAVGTSGVATAQVNSTDQFTVTPANPVVARYGIPVGRIATVADSNTATTAAALSATIFWDDLAPVTETITGGAGSFQINASRVLRLAPGAELRFFLLVCETTENGNCGVTSGSVQMRNGPVTPLPQTIFSAPGVAFSGIVAGMLDANPFTAESHWKSATIDWGDGTTASAGSIIRNGSDGYFVVLGGHTYAAAGSYMVTARSTSVYDEVWTVVSNAVVGANPITASGRTLVLQQGTERTVETAHFTLIDQASTAADFTASINWGDGTAASAGVIEGARGDFAVKGTHNYAKAGQYSTTITITDTRTGGGTATAMGSATVGDTSLTVSAPGGITKHVNEAFTFAFSFTDSDTAATAAKYEVVVDWGDASTASTATVTAKGSGSFDASAMHTYTEVGSNTIAVTISNAGAAGGSTIITSFDVTANVIPAASPQPSPTMPPTSASGDCSMGGADVTTSFPLLLLVWGTSLRRKYRKQKVR
jgi:large repetitive protein